MSSQSLTASQILALDLPPIRWVIEGLLPQGAFLLAGKPKTGKSWFVLQLAIAVAGGEQAFGKYNTNKAGVLYLALEDSHRRLQDRMQSIAPGMVTDNLHFFIDHPSLDLRGIGMLDAWLNAHSDVRLVIIDTWGKAKPHGSGGRMNAYDEDYRLMAPLQTFAKQREIALLIVHHMRKMPGNDRFDEVSGSSALTGSVDGTWVLVRSRESQWGKLHMTGRDIEENVLELRWNPQGTFWSIEQGSNQPTISPERQAILDVLAASAGSLAPADVASAIGKDRNAIKQLMRSMELAGQITKEAKGQYRAGPPAPSKSPVTWISIPLPVTE